MRNGPGDNVRRGRRYDFKRPLVSAFVSFTLATTFVFRAGKLGIIVATTIVPSIVIVVIATAIVTPIVAVAVVPAHVAIVANGAGVENREAPVRISPRTLNDDVAVRIARPTLVDRVVLPAIANLAPHSVVGATVRAIVVGAVIRTRARQ